MLNVPDKRLYRFLNDYKLNLISPADMVEGEFEKFHTDLGLAMRVIKLNVTKEYVLALLAPQNV